MPHTYPPTRLRRPPALWNNARPRDRRREMQAPPAVILEQVSKRFGTGTHSVAALTDVSLRIPPGQYLSIMGQSGSGKSTLLNLVAGLETPTSGRGGSGESEGLARARGGCDRAGRASAGPGGVVGRRAAARGDRAGPRDRA